MRWERLLTFLILWDLREEKKKESEEKETQIEKEIFEESRECWSRFEYWKEVKVFMSWENGSNG